jgi:hypothetical protein
MKLDNGIPTSSIRVVETPEQRRAALEDLGYELFDFELWNYWIFFEESSAERICRDYLIPWFVRDIAGKVRTFSARSVDETPLKFDSFNQLFVFLYLEPVYKNKVLVIVDGGEKEGEILDGMKARYLPNGWSENCFCQLGKHDFEEYYPKRFASQVNAALAAPDKNERRRLKMALLMDVTRFCNEEKEVAQTEFEASAAEVIEILRSVGRSESADAGV